MTEPIGLVPSTEPDATGVAALRRIVGRPVDGVDVGEFGFAFRLTGGGRVLYGTQAAYIAKFAGVDEIGGVVDEVVEVDCEDPLSFGYVFLSGDWNTELRLVLRNGTSGKYAAHLYYIGEEAA